MPADRWRDSGSAGEPVPGLDTRRPDIGWSVQTVADRNESGMARRACAFPAAMTRAMQAESRTETKENTRCPHIFRIRMVRPSERQ